MSRSAIIVAAPENAPSAMERAKFPLRSRGSTLAEAPRPITSISAAPCVTVNGNASGATVRVTSPIDKVEIGNGSHALQAWKPKKILLLFNYGH